MKRKVPSDRRLHALAPTLALVAAAGMIAGCSSSPQATTTTTTTSSTTTSTQLPPATSTSTSSTTTTSVASASAAVIASWLASMTAFYEAGERSDPSSHALLSTLVPNGPELKLETSFLEAQVASGVVGPTTWRLGNEHVVSINGGEATVSGCSYDPGARYASSGAAAPSDLGGGAGYTGYVSTLQLHGAEWLLYSTTVSFPTNTKQAGPCLGF